MNKTEELLRIDKTLDECDRKNGDTPHRAVDRCTRIRVLAGQYKIKLKKRKYDN